MKRIHFASLALTALFALAPIASQAQTAYVSQTPCSSLVSGSTIGLTFAAVESAILAGTFTRAADQNNLLSKLLDAYNKTATAKYYPDAFTKLQNISDAAVSLANAAKPKLDDASGITGAVYVAQACITYP